MGVAGGEVQQLPGRKSVFISYASGDDRPFVKNLADTLIRYGLDVWWDEYEIQIGDSIRTKINEGIRSCGHGVVVLSHDFFARKWPTQELAALGAALETGQLLPIFRGITATDVAQYDPLLADVRGESASSGVHAIAAKISNKVRGPVPTDEQGRAVYRRQQVRVTDLPMNDKMQLHGMVFEDCLLQGPAVLIPLSGLTMVDNYITEPRMFWTLYEGEGRVGGIGLIDVEFHRCRFKDVGITMTPDQQAQLQRAARPLLPGQIPEHLA